MIRNQSYMPQSAVMPEYFQQMQTSPAQANVGPETVNAQTAPAPAPAHCCVDLSQMHHYPYMHDFHDFHHMHHFHPMMDDFHPMMDDFHHMHHFHHMMDDYHPMMHEMWDEHMHYDHHHPHDGWELSTLDYHHAWFHPMMHHHPHHVCFPVTCQPAGELQKKVAAEQPNG